MNRSCRTLIGTAIAVAVLGLSVWGLGRQTAAGPCDIHSRFPGVCLDPGHGGPNAGKLRPPYNNGDGENKNAGSCGPIHIDPDTCVNEAWVNHEIVPLAAGALDENGVYVASTRETITQDLTYTDRCNRANLDPNVDVFISVHHEGNLSVYDTRTYYYDADPMSDWSHVLAQALADKIDEQFHYGKQAKIDSFFVLRNTWMPSALTEASCIGHMSEALLMAAEDDSHRRMEVDGIQNGLFSYGYDTAPAILFCVGPTRFSPGHKLYWSSVPGADGYVVYIDLYASSYECPPTEQTICADFQAATSCTLYLLGFESAVSVRPYVKYPHEGKHFMAGVSNCVARWNAPDCFGTAIDRDISNFYATGGNHEVSLFWHAVSFEEWAGFEIWRSMNGGQSYDSVGYVGYSPEIEDYGLVDTSTAYWMTYYYKIRDTEGYEWWGLASAKPSSGVVMPPVPDPAPVLAVSRLGDQHVNLCLEQGSQYADQYILSCQPEGGVWADTIHGGEQCVELGELQNGVVYCFTAQGENASGTTDLAPIVWATPMASPTNLRDQADYQCVHLWWDGDTSASGYMVYYSTSQYDPWQYSVDVGDTTATTVTGLENGTLYYVCVVAYDQFSNQTGPSNSVSARPECWAGVQDHRDVPREFDLGRSHPNPFGSSTEFAYRLAEPCTNVRLVIYDAIGQEVERLVNEGQPAGYYLIRWDGRDRVGRAVCPGVYFCRLEAGGFSKTEKMLLLR